MGQLYLVEVADGGLNPFSRLGFIVDDEINEGQYDTPQYGDVDSAGEAISAICSAIDDEKWKLVPYAYNGYHGDPTSVELLEPIALDYTNLKQLLESQATNGSEAITPTINGQTFTDVHNYWNTDGDAELFRGTPCGTAIGFDSNTKSIFWTFPVLSSESIVDGKFAFAEGQTYSSYQVRIWRTGSGINMKWHWQAPTSVGHFDVPEEWYALNGTPAGGTDPYDPTGDDESGTGGGEGDQDNWDDDSDPNPVPPVPSLEASDAGFIALYAPTIAQLKSLANYLWGNSFDLDQFKKLFADPMDCILGLSIVPVSVTGSAGTVHVGNINTGVSMNKASSQYAEVNCGTVTITEKYHSYLDYSPYRKISIFLPYIGTRDLDIDIVNGTTIGVKYHVDVLTGGCVAFVTVNGNVIDNYSGQCSINVPITGRDFSNTILGITTLVSGAAGAVATGGLSAPVTAAMVAGGASAAASTAGTVMNSKPNIQKGGSIGSSCGIMGNQKPYIILERPNLCLPGNQSSYTGYPSYITRTLGTLSGFTQVQDIKLNGFSMTETERNELLSLLRSGVIL